MKDEALYIGHILEAIEKIEGYLEGVTEQNFLEEGMLSVENWVSLGKRPTN